MSDLEVFGPLVLATDVENAYVATLKLWMPTYLGFVERHIGDEFGTLPLPGSYTFSSDFNHFPEEQLPAILISSDKLAHPQPDGTKAYRATFPMKVGVAVSSQDRTSSERLAKIYAGVIRSIFTDKGSLEDFAVATDWLSEDYGVHVSEASARTFGAAQLEFQTEVRNVSRRFAGPQEPSSTPGVEPGALPLITQQTPVGSKPQTP